MPPLRPVRKRYTQCSGDDSSPASPAEGLAPVECLDYEHPTSGLTAGWRQVAAATSGTYNGIRNVAAMIHRQPAPARGWPRWMFGIRTSNEWPYGRVAAGCRRYARYVKGIRNVAAMIHRQPAPARGWPRWMFGIRTSNEWPYGQWRQVAAATPGTFNRIRNTVCNQNDKTMRIYCRKCPEMLGKRGKKRNGNKEKVRA